MHYFDSPKQFKKIKISEFLKNFISFIAYEKIMCIYIYV